MKRKLISQLIDWKDLKTRKPILLTGARQVGKTYLLEAFGKKYFKNYHIFDFAEDPQLIELFENSLKPDDLIRRLAIYSNTDINKENDLLIFDEIQHCPKAITSLKYFEKSLPSGFICGSGSLLGIQLSNSPFPVGKVERLELSPLSFSEFLEAMGQDSLAAIIEKKDKESFKNKAIHRKAWEYLLYYFVVGGLPEIVRIFRDSFSSINHAFNLVRKNQRRLIQDYKDDFSKYSGKENALYIRSVFEQISQQLAQKRPRTSRFIFKGVLSEHSTYRDLEGPIEWLNAARLIFKVPICDYAGTPLAAGINPRRFKLYLFDIGILGAMVALSPQAITSYDYGSYKGFFAENFVLQEINAEQRRLIASWNEGRSEIEFMLEVADSIIPIEVKAGINTKAKSLKIFQEKYSPQKSIILTGNPVLESKGTLEFLPLYMASTIV